MNGANISSKGIKRSVQISIIIGYKIVNVFSSKSEEARLNAEMLKLMIDDPLTGANELIKIKGRTLVLVGTRDMIKRKHTELIASKIKDSELVFIKGNHFIANKKSEEVNYVVKKFLETDRTV